MRSRVKIDIDNKKIVTILCVAILFITSWAPFMESNLLGTDTLRRALTYSLWIIVGLAMVIGTRSISIDSFELTAILAILIYRLFNIFYAYDYKGIGLTSIVVGLFFCVQSNEVRASVFKYFKYIMVAVSVIGIVCYISYMANTGLPYDTVSRGGGIFWIDYKLCYLTNRYGMIRLCGTFDEPGWFGTWAAFFLCADGINLKKKENIFILISGILTLSLAFFLLLVVYYVLRNLSDWKRWGWVVVIVVFYLVALPNIKTGNASIDNMLERLVITSEGLVGDNRYGNLFEKVWDEAIQSGKIWTGYGAGYAEIYGTGEGQGLASIKSYIVNFGVIGSLIIFGPLLISSVEKAIKLKNKELLFFVLITYVSLYQRPYLFWNPYLIIFLCGMSYIILNHGEEKIAVSRCK